MGYSHHHLQHDERFFLDSDMHTFDHVEVDDDDQWSLQHGRSLELDDNTDDDDDDSDEWPVLDVSSTHPHLETEESSTLSTEDVIRLAGMRMIHMSSNNHGLSDRDVRNVALTGYLLSSADNVAKGRFDQALGLLRLCDSLSTSQGNPVERVVHYFSKALRVKISKETGTVDQYLIISDDHNILCPDDDMSLVHSRRISQHIAATQAKVEVSRVSSPRFASRFVEMLFHYGALFDGLDTCTGDNERGRVVVESTYLSKLIMKDVVE